MFASRCKKAINADLLVTDKEDGTEQITVTLFDSTIADVIDMNKEESETEEDLLPVKDHNINYSKKMIVTAMFNHSNADKFIIAVARGFFAKFCLK